jgi:hypothetical protein
MPFLSRISPVAHVVRPNRWILAAAFLMQAADAEQGFDHIQLGR